MAWRRGAGPKPKTVARAEALGLTVAELTRVRQQVSCALANLGDFTLYYSRKHKCAIARSIHVKRRFRLPKDAVSVGQYVHGIATRDVLADLVELLEGLWNRPE